MQKQVFMNRRGVSPLIATVLIIGFAIALGAIVILFLRSQVESILEKQPDCGPSDVLNTDMSISCEMVGADCKVTFVNNGAEQIDLARIVANDEVSPAATFINIASGEEFSVTYNVDCSRSVRAFPGKVVDDGEEAKAVLCTDLEVSAVCSPSEI